MRGVVGRAIGGLYQIMRGLKTVGQHTFRPPITKDYPDTMPDLPGAFRGRLALTVNPETGENLCISCRQCERVCPDKCIEITAHKSPETNKLELIDFRIDHGLCMFCGLCTEVCPTLCIINTNDFEMADYSRQSLIYDLKRLTLTQEESGYYFSKKEMPLPKPKPAKAAPKPAGEAAAPASTAAAPASGANPAPTATVAAKPAETKPVEAKSVEAKPVEAKSIEVKQDSPETAKPEASATPAAKAKADTPEAKPPSAKPKKATDSPAQPEQE